MGRSGAARLGATIFPGTGLTSREQKKLRFDAACTCVIILILLKAFGYVSLAANDLIVLIIILVISVVIVVVVIVAITVVSISMIGVKCILILYVLSAPSNLHNLHLVFYISSSRCLTLLATLQLLGVDRDGATDDTRVYIVYIVASHSCAKCRTAKVAA